MKVLRVCLASLALTTLTVSGVNSTELIAKEVTIGNRVNQIAEATTVLVQGQNPGSGVLIDRTKDTYYVLTAKHVVETPDEYEVVTPDGQSYSLQESKIKRLSDLDLALVEFKSDRDYETAPIGLKPTVERGDRIFIAGWPAAGRAIPHIYQITSGEVSGISPRSLAGGYQMIYTNVTRQGMSGGPIFNSKGKVIGIHGQAEGREIYLPDSDSTRVKAGFNLGIPIHQFVKARPEAGPTPLAIASTPTPSRPISKTAPPKPSTGLPESQNTSPSISTPPTPAPTNESVTPQPQIAASPSSEPVSIKPPSIPSSATMPAPQETEQSTSTVRPSPILLAASPNPNIQFIEPPRLINATTTEKTVEQLGARYFFTIEVPSNAGASLEQVDFILKLGVKFPRFRTKGAKVFAGKAKKGKNIPVEMVVTDPRSRTVTVTLGKPIAPGETATVMLKTVKNPSVGTYQYEVRGHADNSQGKGQYIGLGRIEIRPRVKF